MNQEQQTKLIIIVLILMTGGYLLKDSVNYNNIQTPSPITKTKIKTNANSNSWGKNLKAKSTEPIKIYLNPISELNGLSAADIERKRAKMLAKSPSHIEHYKMNRNVYQIVDGLPWISMHEVTCNGVTPKISEGPSRESVNINNPLLLITLSPSAYIFSDKSTCSSADYFFPESLTYYPKENLLSTTINVKSFLDSHNVDISFYGANIFSINGTNARDLGYNYGYIEKSSGVYFKSKTDNLLTDVYDFISFVHKGSACGLPSGCNNVSPYSDSKATGLERLPSFMKIKLWKKRPISKYAKPDLYYEMIFK